MRREFADRAELIAYVQTEFPDSACISPHVAQTLGGWRAAQAALAKIDPLAYGDSRNYLDGAVTRLSPYLRHGVITLAEVRDFALDQGYQPLEMDKFLYELGCRDFFQRIYTQIGAGIWHEREAYKSGYEAADYADALPADILAGQTGLPCMDAFIAELYESGYLHNHARMWLASYLIHWRRVKWQAGAAWFLQHLLDGDPASNHLSWQWVASTFSHQPYIFNREGLERYSQQRYCRTCPLRGHCPFEGAHESLREQLFRPLPDANAPIQIHPAKREVAWHEPEIWPPNADVLVWVHGDALSPHNAALLAYPAAPALFIWDEALLTEWQISLKRLVFMYECLVEVPCEIERGEVAARLIAAANRHGVERIATSASPSPRFDEIARILEQNGLTLEIHHPPPFVRYDGLFDLRRFARYWKAARPLAGQRTLPK